MGVFADSLFAVLMSWVRALVNAFWALFTSERTTVLEFLGKNWLLIVVILIMTGLFMDWMIWLIRWKPYALWAQRVRRILRIAPQGEAEEEEHVTRTNTAVDQTAYMQDDDLEMEGEDDWLPEQPAFDHAQELAAMQRAQAVPDEELGQYPGMRYDEQARNGKRQEMDGTRRFGVLSQEGPGTAEVNRRREEIESYRQEQEAAARLERERRMEAMLRAEQERLEQERREQEAAQAEYQRQMEEYERQKAQYERELAQYQRDMEAYEAAVAAMREDTEAAQAPLLHEMEGKTRARRRQKTYSDLVEGEGVESLPETPEWPQMDKTVSQVKKSAEKKKSEKKNGFVGRMSHLIEPENEEIIGVNALPSRVDPKQAYRPAATPENEQKRRRK